MTWEIQERAAWCFIGGLHHGSQSQNLWLTLVDSPSLRALQNWTSQLLTLQCSFRKGKLHYFHTQACPGQWLGVWIPKQRELSFTAFPLSTCEMLVESLTLVNLCFDLTRWLGSSSVCKGAGKGNDWCPRSTWAVPMPVSLGRQWRGRQVVAAAQASSCTDQPCSHLRDLASLRLRLQKRGLVIWMGCGVLVGNPCEIL